MEKLRKMNNRVVVIGLLVLTFGIGFWMYSKFFTLEYSDTPQETMKKLELAVRRGDSKQIALLFANKQAFERFMDVPIGTGISRLSATALKRSTFQSSLQAWNQWFYLNGDKLIYNSENGRYSCGDPDESFAIGFSRDFRGYLIDYCDYAL